MIEVHKKQGETSSSLYFRFTKKIRQSGVMIEVRKRRFRGRASNKLKIRRSAKHRSAKAAEIKEKKKLGIF